MNIILPECGTASVGDRAINPVGAFDQRQCPQLALEVPL
jgi:hypothetical protein